MLVTLELELRSVAARPGSVVMAVTPELLEVAKFTPTGSVPFSPLLSMNPNAVTCKIIFREVLQEISKAFLSGASCT